MQSAWSLTWKLVLGTCLFRSLLTSGLRTPPPLLQWVWILQKKELICWQPACPLFTCVTFRCPLYPPHPSNAPEIAFAYAKSKAMNIQRTLCQLQTTNQRQHSLSSPTALSCAPLNWSQILTPRCSHHILLSHKSINPTILPPVVWVRPLSTV